MQPHAHVVDQVRRNDESWKLRGRSWHKGTEQGTVCPSESDRDLRPDQPAGLCALEDLSFSVVTIVNAILLHYLLASAWKFHL